MSNINWWSASCNAALGKPDSDLATGEPAGCRRSRLWLCIAVIGVVCGGALAVRDIPHNNDPITDYPILAPGGATGAGGTFIVRLPGADQLPDAKGI